MSHRHRFEGPAGSRPPHRQIGVGVGILWAILTLPAVAFGADPELRVIGKEDGPVAAMGFFDKGRQLVTTVGSTFSVYEYKSGKKKLETVGSNSSSMVISSFVVSSKKGKIVYPLGPSVQTIDLKTGEKPRSGIGGFTLAPVVGFGGDAKHRWIFLGHNDGRIQRFNFPRTMSLEGTKSRTVADDMAYMCMASAGEVIACVETTGVIKLVDASSIKETGIIPAPSQTIRGIVLSPKGDLLAALTGPSSVTLWSTRSKKVLHQISTEATELRAPVFDPKGKRLAAVDDEGRLMMWDVKSAELLRADHPVTGSPRQLEFHPKGDRLAAAGSWDGVILIPLD